MKFTVSGIKAWIALLIIIMLAILLLVLIFQVILLVLPFIVVAAVLIWLLNLLKKKRKGRGFIDVNFKAK